MFCKLHRARAEKGFTLVELLVVIGIIGILALLLLPQFRGMRDRARVASCQSNLKNLSSQLEAEFVDRDSYPDAAVRWAALIAAGGSLERLANCPLGPTVYGYVEDSAITPDPDETVIDDLAGVVATAPGMGYVANCAMHNGAAVDATAGYPTVVQLYTSPDGVVRKQTFFP